ncbi:MAG TPA: TonB family protein [Candidatus Acidoferrum sp.]|nr:TonB family protein [Candidatus Acidoferrum sp.]
MKIKPVSALLFVLACALLAARGAAQQSGHAARVPPANAEKIRAHVKYLSSDALEGRGMGQPGGELAADYIAKQFASYGLQPAGEDGFFQKVSMVAVKTLPETSFQFASPQGEPLTLKFLDDFVTNNESQRETSDIDAPIVFIGYGIQAPEYQWDDYKGQDLKGKVALLFVNEPVSDDPNFFKGKALTYYGRWTYKLEETARRGALATLIIHRTDLASYPWEVVRNSWGNEKSYLQLDGTPKLQAASWITQETAKKLVHMANLDLDQLFQQAQSRDFQPIALNVNLKAHLVSRLRPFVSRNVLAMREGSDSTRSSEAVLYTAHYDHFGIDPSRKAGDQIYHGAVDNGTGCGMLLELARVWGKAKTAPPRSILFAAVTGEEQGLLGSEYMGKRSAYLPVEPILDLNFDALAPLGIPEEVEVSGAERTTFYPTVEQTAKQFALTIQPDSRPEAGHYYRSDHFSLARVGIPSFSISEGLKFTGHDRAWGDQQFKDYVSNHYHQPSDEYHADWNFKGLAKMVNFGAALGLAAATQTQSIDWLPGDEFAKYHKKLAAGTFDADALFAGRPDLHLVSATNIMYPPLARQTRIGGTVVLDVTVAPNGSVSDAQVVSGHPLLLQATIDGVKKWLFAAQAGQQRSFELQVEYLQRGAASAHPNIRDVVVGPLHLVILANYTLVEQAEARTAK